MLWFGGTSLEAHNRSSLFILSTRLIGQTSCTIVQEAYHIIVAKSKSEQQHFNRRIVRRALPLLLVRLEAEVKIKIKKHKNYTAEVTDYGGGACLFNIVETGRTSTYVIHSLKKHTLMPS